MADLQRAQFSNTIEENRGKFAYKSAALSIAQRLDFVKTYDGEFTPALAVNPALLNADGRPTMIFRDSIFLNLTKKADRMAKM